MLPQSVLVFDIETIPDVALGRRLYGLESLADDDVVKAMRTLRVQKNRHHRFSQPSTASHCRDIGCSSQRGLDPRMVSGRRAVIGGRVAETFF